MNIVVIDDEKIIANAFFKLISTNFKDESVNVFYKPNDVLKFASYNRIDILVCDIDMPLLNGIELSKQLKNSFKSMRTLFLTGMDTFDYIYNATKVKDSRYVLKIEDDETIINNIKEMIQELNEIETNDKSHLNLINEKNDLLVEKYRYYMVSLVNDMLINKDFDIGEGYFSLILLDKEIDNDNFFILANIFSHFLNIKCENIFKIDNKVLGIYSSFILNKDIFSHCKEVIYQEHNIIINIIVSTLKVNKDTLNNLFTKMNSISYLSDTNKGFYFILEELYEQKDDDNVKLISKIKDYIYEHTNEDISLKKISEVMHYNESYLSRLFKKLTGKNFKDLVTDVKIKKAMYLLSETDLMVRDIAIAVGFDSISHFQYFFKKNKGITPLEYRRDNINNN